MFCFLFFITEQIQSKERKVSFSKTLHTALFCRDGGSRAYVCSAGCPRQAALQVPFKRQKHSWDTKKGENASHTELYIPFQAYSYFTSTLPRYKTKGNVLESSAHALWSSYTLWSLMMQPPSMVLAQWTNTAAVSWRSCTRLNARTLSSFYCCQFVFTSGTAMSESTVVWSPFMTAITTLFV